MLLLIPFVSPTFPKIANMFEVHPDLYQLAPKMVPNFKINKSQDQCQECGTTALNLSLLGPSYGEIQYSIDLFT